MDAIVLGQATRAGWARDMMDNIAEGLNAIGVHARRETLDPETAPRIQAVIREWVSAGREFFLLVPNGKVGTGPVPCFNYIMDHPLLHADFIAANGEGAAFGVVDRRHANLSRLGIGVRAPSVFVPHGGPEVIADPLPWDERDIDVLFPANIAAQPHRREWPSIIPSPGAVRDIFLHAVEHAIEEYEDAYFAVVAACDALSIDMTRLPRATASTLVDLIEACAQAHLRHKVLSRARGVRPHVVGAVPTNIFDGPMDHVTFHGDPPFAEILAMVRRSKFVLNVTPKFLGGSHDRVWNTIARGSNVITTDSTYLRRSFTHGENVLFLPRDGVDWGDLVAGLLDKPAKLAAMAASARTIYQAKHTWKHRAGLIAAVMTPLVRSFVAGGVKP